MCYIISILKAGGIFMSDAAFAELTKTATEVECGEVFYYDTVDEMFEDARNAKIENDQCIM